MKTLLLACILFCALGWSRVYAQNADTLLAQSKQAAGGDAWNDILSLSITSERFLGGSQMVKEQHYDVRRGRYLTTYRLGSFSAAGRSEDASGYDGKTAWEMDTSGYSHTITDAASLRRVTNETYLACYAYWFPGRAPAKRQYAGHTQDDGREFDIIQISPDGGQPLDLWINSTTHLIDRFVEQEPMGVATTYFSDYSPAGGLKFPYTIRYVYAKRGSDVTDTVRQVETSTVDAKIQFGVPPPPTPDYHMPAGQASVTVPFQFFADHIFIPIFINGKGPFTAALDTGSSSSVIAPALAEKLKLTQQGTVQGIGLGEKPVSGSLVGAEAMQIGGITLTKPTFAVIEIGGLSLNAVVGYEVLRRFVVRIDYDTRLLTLTRPENFVHPDSGGVLPIHMHGNIPAVDGTVDGVKGMFTLDTGSGSNLDLFGPFIQAHDLRHKYEAGLTSTTGIGLGGITQGQTIHIEKLTLGKAEIRKVNTNLSVEQSGVASDVDIAGNIGEGVLRQFNTTFDYTHGQVILEKNKRYDGSEDGVAGFALELQGNGWRITEVIPGSAAAQAGIREGDKILELEGKNAGLLPLYALWDVFDRPVGTKVWLLLQQGQQKRLVAITLGKAP